MTSKRAILTDLAATRDEARLRMHLLSLEARERWYDLETALDSVEHKLQGDGETLTASMIDGARGVTRSVQQFLACHARATGLATPAGSVMTRGTATCLSYASLKHAVQVMRSAGRSAVPVVDGDGKLLGIVTERDLCDAACMQGKRFSEVTVDTAMTENPYSCSREDSVARLLEIMSDAQVHELPVVDADRRVLGIVDIANLARFVVESPSAQQSTGEALLKAIIALSAVPANNYHAAAE